MYMKMNGIACPKQVQATSMKRQLNTIKKFFDGRAAALSEVLVPSGKEPVLVLRTKSTTDVVESNEENPDSTEISNRLLAMHCD